MPDARRDEIIAMVERFTVRNGKIARMDVWNDSAERLLERAGLAR